MTTPVEMRFPRGAGTDVSEMLVSLSEPPLRVGDPRVVSFLTETARSLLRPSVARAHPEVAPLGFFLRRGELERLLRHLESDAQGRGRLFRFPRGLVFHVPPANVDTIFVYAWALSALCGNWNIVRISPRAGGAAGVILDVLNAALADADPVIAQTQKMIVYGHDDSITAALSAACDLRVLWGGDASVAAIRSHPLGPMARDLTFPDRTSFAIASGPGWHEATPKDRRRATKAFFNDAYWFDQAACASPRSLVWIGEEEPARRAREEFVALLQGVIEAEGYEVGAAMAVHKRVLTYGAAADASAGDIRFHSNALATLELPTSRLGRRWLGAGSIAQMTLGSLGELTPMVQRRDQTLCVFGFDREELEEFVQHTGGAGLDRIVPWGSALSFSPIWDGYDLVREFTRITTLES